MPDSNIVRQTIEHSFFFLLLLSNSCTPLVPFDEKMLRNLCFWLDEMHTSRRFWQAHFHLPAISCTKNNFYIPPLKNYINNSPGGGKMRLASNFSPRRKPGPALHILVVRGQLCFLAEAELIQLNWKRHGLAFFFCVHGGHRAKRWTLSLCHSVNRASVS